MKLNTSPLKPITRLIVFSCIAVLSACAVGPPTADQVEVMKIEAAKSAIADGRYDAAYDLLDDVVWLGHPDARRVAISMIKGNERVLGAATIAIKRHLVQAASSLGESDFASESSFLAALSRDRSNSLGMIDRLKELDPQADINSITSGAYDEARNAAGPRLRAQGDADLAKAGAERAGMAERAALIARLAKAERVARIDCQDKLGCEKAFSLTQIYISLNADMKIQVATDAVIETYNPTDDGKIAMKAIRMPHKGEGSTIILTVACKDVSASFFRLCAESRIKAYEGFAPFVRGSL